MAKAAQGPRMSLPQGKALISLMAMRLRGGGNVLHEESWDVGKGIRVHVKVRLRETENHYTHSRENYARLHKHRERSARRHHAQLTGDPTKLL
jgi:hypothetical protein